MNTAREGCEGSRDMRPKIREIYDTHEDVMNDDGEPVDPDLERDEEWHEKYRVVVDEDEAGL